MNNLGFDIEIDLSTQTVRGETAAEVTMQKDDITIDPS